MEILFVFIEKFNGLNEEGICLTSKFDINYNKYTHTITIKDSDYNLTNTFNSNILDIKALIGSNGSGKTSLLKYLFSECTKNEDFDNTLNKRDFIICLKNEKIYITYNKLYKINDENISDNRKNKNKIILAPFEGKLLLRKTEVFKGTGLIYFSNLFDNSQIEIQNDSAFNISTNYLLKTDKRFNYKQADYYGLEQTECYRSQELIRQISFINGNTTNFNFKIPDFLNFEIDDHDENVIRNVLTAEPNKNSRNKSINDYNEKIREVLLKTLSIRNNIQYESVLIRFWFELRISVLYNYLRFCNFILLTKHAKFDNIRKHFSEALLNSFTERNFDFKKFNLDIEKAQNVYFIENKAKMLVFSEELNKYRLFILLTTKIIKKENIYRNSARVYRKNIHLDEWLNLYQVCKKHNDFLIFNWIDFSSGEMARINLLSRFYYCLKGGNVQRKNNYIVLIDEGDIFFHPNWQRKFISILNNDLASLFGHKKIQIILTSHSPFLTSDLTKSHIHFFKPKKIEIREQEETFAQNIYTLFSDSFYLESPIGEFAENLLNETINFLDKGDSKRIGSLIEAQKVIDCIGEPMIKNEMQKKLLNSSIGDKHQLKKIVEYLNKKLENYD